MTTLEWDGCLNVRDLGGFPTEDGRRTRSGAVVRSDNVRQLTEAGWRALEDHGVTRIVDLRWAEELAADEPRDVDVDVVHVPVLGEYMAPESEYVKQLDERLDRVEDVAEYFAWSYVDFLERFRDRFGEAVAAVADAPAGGVLVHCAGGKDRTGLVTALLLRVAGVSNREIGRDYSLSGPNLAPLRDGWLASATGDADRRRRAKLTETPAHAMERVLEQIEKRYGGVASYLRAAGVTDEQLDRIRERLVAP